MRTFDQLDWVHAFDDFEMVMYANANGDSSDGIYMQVLERKLIDGAETWDILYDRQLTNIIGDVGVQKDDPSFEDEVLRVYLNQNPNLVEDEKQYLRNWLQSAANGER